MATHLSRQIKGHFRDKFSEAIISSKLDLNSITKSCIKYSFHNFNIKVLFIGITSQEGDLY